MRSLRGTTDAAWIVALILLISYAYFWHSRDWNTASRLILTYAIVDRGTVVLDGLDTQTGDIAFFKGHYYCDKLPGFSLWATVPYSLARVLLRLPAHPLAVPALPHWPADYWITLGSSGVFTVLTAVLLVRLARAFGCTPGRAGLVGLAYGLCTPAYVYATLAYGHQLSAAALFGSFVLIWKQGRGSNAMRPLGAGFLAAVGPLVELQVGPASAILGLYLLAQCVAGRRRPDALAWFAIGALVPTLCLLGYNVLAFGSPWEMGYFHHATAIFARVHNRDNPLGLSRPDLGLVGPLLWGQYRGLFYYAPILLLAPVGWAALIVRRKVAIALVSLSIAAAVFLVNLSYPEWTGGWSTGPRLLVPLLPFAMVPVAGLLAIPGRWSRPVFVAALVLSLAGGVLMLLFQGVGARVPQDVRAPLTDLVWPLWSGTSTLPRWWTGQRFSTNLVSLLASRELARLPGSWQWLQFVPLLTIQAIGASTILRSRSDLGVDQQQKRGGADENAQDPEAEAKRLVPDPGP
jgi:hypothetical protein